MAKDIVFYPDRFNYNTVRRFSEEWFWREYWDKLLSIECLADTHGVSQAFVSGQLRRFNIPTRRPGGAYATWTAGRRMEKCYLDGKMNSPTSIELALYEELTRLDIDFRKQFSPPKYSRIYDALVLPDILVEVHGDYWHGRLEQQLIDEYKEAWAHDHNYQFVVIWEHEIHEVGIRQLVKDRISVLIERQDNEIPT